MPANTLTGENRAYDKRGGTLAREYFGKPGPYENAWIVRDANGHLCWGRGAWEIAARYSYVDLNSGVGKGFCVPGVTPLSRQPGKGSLTAKRTWRKIVLRKPFRRVREWLAA